MGPSAVIGVTAEALKKARVGGCGDHECESESEGDEWVGERKREGEEEGVGVSHIGCS